MPRKNAGKTKQPSRNPAGRGPGQYAGDRKQHLFYITNDAKDTAKTLAAFAGVSQGEFVETLIRQCGPDKAAQLKLEREQQDAGGDAVAGGSVAAADVSAGGAPGSED